MNRVVRTFLASIVAVSVVLAPTAASANDDNVVVAGNNTDGAAVARASVDYEKVASGTVDQENRAYAAASCTGCQTLAVAFQLVLVTRPVSTLAPVNEAFAVNYECEQCLTWASAKQVVVETGGPAGLTRAGRTRLQALENDLEALEDQLPSMTLEELVAAIDAAFAEFLDVAQTEVVRTDGGRDDARVVTARSS